MPRSLLAIDVGGGTQDILLYEEGKNIENSFKLVLPSPTVVIANKIRRTTKEGRGIHLTGGIMGGGPSSKAIREHLGTGFPVSAEKEAAKTIKDSLKVVEEMGVELRETPPPGYEIITLGDLDLEGLKQALAPFEVGLPQEVAIAVQDHGDSPDMSNRLFRFKHWERFLKGGGDIRELAYSTPPSYLTRMKAAQKTSPGALVMDTCSAALWGVLADKGIKQYQEEGMVVVNIGNQHTFAVLLKGWRALGLFEHHTKMMTREKLEKYLELLRLGELTHQEIFDDGGHGSFIAEKPDLKEFSFVAVTGPRRSLAEGLGYHFAAPHGDMMLTGCFGLVDAWKNRQS